MTPHSMTNTSRDGVCRDGQKRRGVRRPLWLTDAGALKVRGFIGFSLFGRTMEWTRVVGETG